jgi:uncharacterized Zn-binding protein involved in type VI secretion
MRAVQQFRKNATMRLQFRTANNSRGSITMKRPAQWMATGIAVALLAASPVGAQTPGGTVAPETPPTGQAPATGSESVFINGKPGQRLGDQPPGALPGQPGAVEASPNVFINGKPAVVCANGVKSGSSNVFINGKPAARAGDCN